MDLTGILFLGAVVVVLLIGAMLVSSKQKAGLEADKAKAVEGVKRAAEEDVTVFGEELQELHFETLTDKIDPAMRQDYQRALASYETAKDRLGLVDEPEDVQAVTQALEDGRYAMACVLARRDGQPLPTRRPPCFFNPQHGPSTTDIEWAPPGGQPRHIPVCAADEDRVRQGAEPDIRTVDQGRIAVPYWQAGKAYQPYSMGYYNAYADLLPMFFVMTMLNSMWMGGMVDAFDTGGYGDAYSDGYDAGYSDGAGDGGGYDGGGDGGGYDSGGYDGGSGFDGGGFDIGGGFEGF